MSPGAEQPVTVLAWAVLLLSAAAALGLAILMARLARMFARTPRLAALSESDEQLEGQEDSLTVVVPTNNEATNIGPCLTSVLRSEPPCAHWRVLLVREKCRVPYL